MENEELGCTILFLGPDPPPAPGYCRVEWVPLLAWEPINKSSIILIYIYKYFDSIAITSPRAVKALYKDAAKHNIINYIRKIGQVLQVYAIGSSTSSAAASLLGWTAITPKKYTVEELARLISSSNSFRILGLRSPSANRALQEILAEAGKVYVEEYVYYTRIIKDNLSKIDGIEYDYIAVTSSSIARTLKKVEINIGEKSILSIGPETTRTLVRLGLKPLCTASEHTLRGLIMCAEKYYKKLFNGQDKY